jgi:DNA-binding CsgD family transcriptional regulator
MVAMQEISLDYFDKLVHDIYRAGIQPDLWSEVVGTLSHLLGGAVISLQAHSIVSKASLGTITSEADSSVQNDYENYYATKNVWMPGLQNIPKGRTIHAEEFFDRRELKRTEFYNDFLRPRGFIGASALILERSENAVLFEDIPVALLILRDQAAPDRVEALREFKLTPAEAALTLAIAKGLSLREYAEGRDLSIQTVRTQLKAVFAKTDTNRQSQLVALVMSL